MRPRIVRLRGCVQHYEWGGYDYIPNLLGIPNEQRKPYAELWIGAHPSAPCVADFDHGVALDELLAQNAEGWLGPDVAAQFGGRLPYLFKVLDARQMLSIQAHPSKQQAEEGFARENAGGIPISAPHRNYKDDNHKPEVHVALTDFWLLHGFRPMEQIARLSEETAELTPLLDRMGSIRDVYERVMTAPASEIEACLSRLLTRLEREQPRDKSKPGYWAWKAGLDFGCDRGIVSIYLLNLVYLKPGQGTYQPSGVLHAYLEGVNVELMANSDNVLRGGLTSKYVDVPELMKNVCFDSAVPKVLEPGTVYATPAKEFELRRIELPKSGRFVARGPESLLFLEGARRGEILFVPHGAEYELAGEGVVFQAAVPL